MPTVRKAITLATAGEVKGKCLVRRYNGEVYGAHSKRVAWRVCVAVVGTVLPTGEEGGNGRAGERRSGMCARGRR